MRTTSGASGTLSALATLALLFAVVEVAVLTGRLSPAESFGSPVATARPATARPSGPPVRVATYNVLGSEFASLGARVGGTTQARASRAAQVVRGEDGESGRGFDVVGFQEMQPDQDALFHRRLPGYDAFPASGESRRPIYWKRQEFALVSSGSVSYPGYRDPVLATTEQAPWVQLRDLRSGRVLTVLNVHAVAWNAAYGSDLGGAEKREVTAVRLRSWAAPRIRSGERVVVLGDLNSTFVPRAATVVGRVKDEALGGDRGRLPYCVLTQAGLLTNTYDLAHAAVRERVTGCPTTHSDLGRLVDAVYVSPGIRVGDWRSLGTALTRQASDHRPTYVDLTF